MVKNIGADWLKRSSVNLHSDAYFRPKDGSVICCKDLTDKPNITEVNVPLCQGEFV